MVYSLSSLIIYNLYLERVLVGKNICGIRVKFRVVLLPSVGTVYSISNMQESKYYCTAALT